MANYTYAQLEAIWLQAAQGTQYATQTWAALMAAIAEAESGGNPAATNPTDNNGTQTSWGLWQISNGTHSQPSPNWNNPLVNAQLALSKLQGQGLGAWGTYTSGAYKAFQNGSTSPDPTGLTAADLTAATSAAAAGSSAAQSAGSENCAWAVGFGGIPGGSWLSGLFGVAGLATQAATAGEVCVISKPQVRALAGLGVMTGGLVLLLNGISILTAASAVGVVGRLVSSVTGGGGGGAAGGAAAAGSRGAATSGAAAGGSAGELALVA